MSHREYNKLRSLISIKFKKTMNLIKKWWVRLIISLVLGGIITETIIVSTDGEIGLNAFVLGIGIYLVLSLIYGFYARKQNN